MNEQHGDIRGRLADHVAATAAQLGLSIGPGVAATAKPYDVVATPDGKRRLWQHAWREVDAGDPAALLSAATDLLTMIVAEFGPGKVWPFSDVPLLHFIEPGTGGSDLVLGGKMRIRTMYVHEVQPEAVL